MSAVGRIALFLSLGPLIGAVVFILVFGTWLAIRDGHVEEAPAGLQVLFSPPGLMACYVFGGIPAALTGIAVGVVARRTAALRRRLIWAAGLGLVIAVVGCNIMLYDLWGMMGGFTAVDAVGFQFALALAGIAAAVGCTALLYRPQKPAPAVT